MREEVSRLIDTSVEDMKSSLECAEENGELRIDLLKEALRYAIRFGEITRQKILKRYIKRISPTPTLPKCAKSATFREGENQEAE